MTSLTDMNLERIIQHPRVFVHRPGRELLSAYPTHAEATDAVKSVPGGAVLQETPLGDVYVLTARHADTGRRLDYEFCVLEQGRRVAFIPAMQGPDRTRLLVKFATLMGWRLVAQGAQSQDEFGSDESEKRAKRIIAWKRAVFRLQGPARSLVTPNLLVPTGTSGLPS